MQGYLTVDWEQIDIRSGIFKQYTVQGVKYQNKRGETTWHTTTWPEGGNPMHDFWVSDGDFRAFSIHHSYGLTNENRLQIGEVIDRIDTGERSAIMAALASWEK